MQTALGEVLANRIRRLTQARLGVLAVAGAMALAARGRFPEIALEPALLVLAFAGVVNGAILLWLRRPGHEEAAHTLSRILMLQLLLDVLALTAGLHFTGGAENPFYPFYVFPVMLAAALLAHPAALIFASLSSVFYSALLLAEYQRWVPHYHLAGLQDAIQPAMETVLIGQAAALAITCFLGGWAVAVLVGALHRRAGELEASQQRAETRSAQLRALNEQLRAANEECGRSRNHLDTLYGELEQAYNRLQTRSSHMSELNEQLRAANAECKQQREELAEVYAKLQEAYRRQESRGEHMRELNEQLRVAAEECRLRRDELTALNAQLAQANTRLRTLDDERSQFTLLLTHELRAPVAAIQSYLKLILEGYVPPEKLTETLKKADKRTSEQLALIGDLLELGRVQGTRARGRVGPVRVEEALADQLDQIAPRAQERGIVIETDIRQPLLPVLSNDEEIRSVWNNLLTNAVKYNQDGGHVLVSLQQQEDRIVGSVQDTGIGIPPDAMPRLFSEFFRAENAKEMSRMGTGLGLSIVKTIVERAGGQITVASTLGEGTTFRFWIPVLSQSKETEPEPESARNGAGQARQ